MIDTDKYEGHSPGPWELREGARVDDEAFWLDIVAENGEIQENVGFSDTKTPADVCLMVDAPLLLAEVKRLRSDLEINYQARRELEFETLEQQVLIYKLMKRNEWLEEVVALAQEHGAIDLSDYGWPQWGEEE